MPAILLGAGLVLILAALAMASRKDDAPSPAPAAFVMLAGHLFVAGALALSAMF